MAEAIQKLSGKIDRRLRVAGGNGWILVQAKPIVRAFEQSLDETSKQFRMTDSAAVEGAYRDVATLVRLEEGRKPYVSLEGMRILQRLLAPQNPKIGSLKIDSLIDTSIMKRIDDSGFFDKVNAEYGK